MNEINILVVSDSHGNIDNMRRAVELIRPDMLLHLGDGLRDAEALSGLFPTLHMETVPGNCDYRRDEPAERVILAGGRRIMLCHGHTLGVKNELGLLLRSALERGADAVLFGHTHKPFVDIRRGVVMLNPGSIGSAARPTFGTLTLGENSLIPATHVLKLENH